jgi:hypothetical protein
MPAIDKWPTGSLSVDVEWFGPPARRGVRPYGGRVPSRGLGEGALPWRDGRQGAA